ncbi:high mobility group nucleosome-binding domain-containing protein 5-like [Clytia hemisphaerica]
MLMFWLFLIPTIVLARPRGHHSANKRQHVAINLGEKLNIEDKSPNELDIVRQEDDMIKSNLLPNMKDMMVQQQQAQVEENSGLRFPSIGNNPFSNSPVEMNNKKPASEQQNFWLGSDTKDENVGELPQIENDFHTKIEGEKTTAGEAKLVKGGEKHISHGRENEDSHTEGENENAGLIKDKMSHEDGNEALEKPGNKENQDGASRRDDTGDLPNENPFLDKELEDPKGKLIKSGENHHEESYQEDGHSISGKQDISANRRVSHSYRREQKPDGDISDVLKSVFGENGDPNYPVERQF